MKGWRDPIAVRRAGGPIRARRRGGPAGLLLGAVLMGPGSPVSACGYHDVDSVGFQIGVLNWRYPYSLHVNAPIWQAQEEGLLPSYDISRMMASGSHRRFLDSVAYQRTDRALRALGGAIGTLVPAGQRQALSLVLVENALWARFDVSASEYDMTIDAGGPREGDLVMVTGEPVIFGIGKGKLTLASAFASGMIKLYGEPDEADRFLNAFGDIGAGPLPDDKRVASPSALRAHVREARGGLAPGRDE